MLFNSGEYLLFVPVVLLVFYLIPSKDRIKWLLLCSYYFYMCWNVKFLLLLIISTGSTYATGLLIDKINNKDKSVRCKKVIVSLCIIFNLGILIFFKYTNFILQNINRVGDFFNIGNQIPMLDILLPVGISFYTFQAVGYICDVYNGKIKAERDFVKYALFVSFFPQVCAGPIERAPSMLRQYDNMSQVGVTWDVFKTRMMKGGTLILWGYFQKLVIADRAAILVDTVYTQYTAYSAVDIIFATVIYGVQIYCDFDGYSNIARGSAELLGIHLMENFKRPYLATSIKQFWARWHISLTSWFTDYLYIPLGGNRKGNARKYLNILIVFAVSGLWHGASWHYMAWGMIHGFFLVIYNMCHRKKQNTCRQCRGGTRFLQAVITFLMVDFAWLFFRAQNFRTALAMIKKIIFSFDCYLTFPNEIFSHAELQILLMAIALLVLLDFLHEKNIFVMKKILEQERWFSILIVAICVYGILIFGVYGGTYDVSKFIYFQF